MRKGVWILGIAIAAVLAWLLLHGGGESTKAPVERSKRPGPAAPAPASATPAPVPEAEPAESAPTPPARPPATEVPPPAAAPKGELTVSGRVSFPDDRPAVGITIQASPNLARAETDSTGRYILKGLPPGKVDVWLVQGDLRKTVEAGAADADFLLKDHRVRVLFVDEQGGPFEEGSYSYQGTLGKWECGGAGIISPGSRGIDVAVPTGTRLLYSGKAPGRFQAAGEFVVEGEASDHTIRVLLPPVGETGALALHALDDAGRPARSITVTIKDVAGGLLEDFYKVRLDLDAEGKVVLEKIQPGTFDLKAGAGGPQNLENFALDMVTRVEVEAGKSRPVELLLKSGGWLRVTVKDRTGKVLNPGDPRVLDEKGEYVSGLFWGTDGKGKWWNPPQKAGPAYYERPLPPGRYTVEVLRGPQLGEEKVIATAEALVAWRQITDVEVVLQSEEVPGYK